MNHKDRKNTYKRIAGKKNAPRQFILFVEGRNTEKSYFDLLKKTNCKVTPVTRKGHGISRCVDFVNESYKAWMSMPKDEKNRYDQRWLVFDADGRPDFAEGIKLARELQFGVAFSNMCIEYWFVLHFVNHNGDSIPLLEDSHSAAQIKMLNDYISKYNKAAAHRVAEYDSGSKTVDEDFFDLMMANDPQLKKSRIVLAFERAKAIHERKKTNGAEFLESVTTIYQLLLELGVIEESDNGYVLYRR